MHRCQVSLALSSQSNETATEIAHTFSGSSSTGCGIVGTSMGDCSASSLSATSAGPQLSTARTYESPDNCTSAASSAAEVDCVAAPEHVTVAASAGTSPYPSTTTSTSSACHTLSPDEKPSAAAGVPSAPSSGQRNRKFGFLPTLQDVTAFRRCRLVQQQPLQQQQPMTSSKDSANTRTNRQSLMSACRQGSRTHWLLFNLGLQDKTQLPG